MFASLFGPARGAGGPAAFGYLSAVSEHVQWKQRFEAALRAGGEDQVGDEVAQGAGTPLAAWLARVAATPAAADPMLHRLSDAFFRFHGAAAHALGLAQSGDTAAAQRCIARGDYADASQRIKRLLVELERRRFDPAVPPQGLALLLNADRTQGPA